MSNSHHLLSSQAAHLLPIPSLSWRPHLSFHWENRNNQENFHVPPSAFLTLLGSYPFFLHSMWSFMSAFLGYLIQSPPLIIIPVSLSYHPEFHHSHLKMVTSAPKTTWLVSQISNSGFPVWKTWLARLGSGGHLQSIQLWPWRRGYTAQEAFIKRLCSEKGIKGDTK